MQESTIQFTNDASTDTVNTFYCEEEISTAQDTIWEHYKDIMHDKKKKNVKLKHMDDLITAVGKIEHHHSNSDHPVVFVARNLKRCPNVIGETCEKSDMEKRVNMLELQMKQLLNAKVHSMVDAKAA